MFSGLGCRVKAVRYARDLDNCNGLVIPGGESTTISKQLDGGGLREALVNFARERPVMGTCAGLILMARNPSDNRVKSLDLLHITIARNSWGRQVHSFTTTLDLQLNGRVNTIPAVFIRAPRIIEIGPEVEVLTRIQDEPALVRQGCHLGVAFHPELSNNTSVHQMYLDTLRA